VAESVGTVALDYERRRNALSHPLVEEVIATLRSFQEAKCGRDPARETRSKGLLLDVVFADDQSRLRKGHGAHNMAIVRHFALNLVRTAPDSPRPERSPLKRGPKPGSIPKPMSLVQGHFRAQADDQRSIPLGDQRFGCVLE